MMKRLLPVMLLALGLVACKTKNAQSGPKAEESVELPPIVISPKERPDPIPAYQPSQEKAFDLIHTRLEVSFDWQHERMPGKAWLSMRPWFYPKSSLVLEGKGFIINRVALEENGLIKDLQYKYRDNHWIEIDLGRSYGSQETFTIFIDYIARPSELKGLLAEGDNEDPGLYFINAQDQVAGKPRQIWTQGESHGAPGWFPTFDTPNQKCTQEISMTVESGFKTLSNGLLMSSTDNPDGTRTDHWMMSLPNAPYLFMMAAGDFSIVKENWRGKEVSYYVEPKFAQYAKLIFGKTPEMMEFYSQRLGVDYPWEKYNQVVVRDFVSGAMENTSATVHFGGLQHNARQHIDQSHEDIIAHELFHQWFGDLVTCESWANLTLNEGFATYGEYLWNEYKYGPLEAMYNFLQDRRGYLRESKRKQLPLIRYHHISADEMFDAHSYQKGGQVLQMLRKELGDDAFFAGLKHYLKKHQFQSVEVHDLRLAMEDVSGRDLNWFFDQWFLSPGHPKLDIQHQQTGNKYTLTVTQTQDSLTTPIFEMPLEFDIYFRDGQREFVQAKANSRVTTIELELKEAPEFVVFDPSGMLLCEVLKENKTESQWLAQLKGGKDALTKMAAIPGVEWGKDASSKFGVLSALAKEEFAPSRIAALETMMALDANMVKPVLETVNPLLKDPSSEVRAAVLEVYLTQMDAAKRDLSQAELSAMVAGMTNAVKDSSYVVSNLALSVLYDYDSVAGLEQALLLAKENDPRQASAVTGVLMSSKHPQAMEKATFWVRNPEADGMVKSGVLRKMGDYLQSQPAETQMIGKGLCLEILSSKDPWWSRYQAITILEKLPKDESTKQAVMKLRDGESQQYLLAAMNKYLDGE